MEDFITRPICEKFDYDGDILEVVEKGDAREGKLYLWLVRKRPIVSASSFKVVI